MINNARGSHSSPGTYMKETEVNYSVKSLGITTLGVAGETLKGPAFESIGISKWSEYVDYFGETSTEKFVGTGYPKYELPYIAKEYLKESKQLEVVRVLGLSGYDAGKLWAITVKKDNGNATVVGILRSKASYNTGDTMNWSVSSITSTSAVTKNEITLAFSGVTGIINTCKVSLNSGKDNFITKVLGSNPLAGSYPVFVESFYSKGYNDNFVNATGVTAEIKEVSDNMISYQDSYQCAETPWIVSDVDGNNVKKLFKFYTISDGDSANYEVKISFKNINKENGTFDVIVRAMSDSDSNPIILETFSKCDLVYGSSNYLPLKIGTVDGAYPLKSKYIMLELGNEEEIAGLVPYGFLGYPLHKIDECVNMGMPYNITYDDDVKAKKQYFGISDRAGIDYDILAYKGSKVNTTGKTVSDYLERTNGFHMNSSITTAVTVDGKTGDTFTPISSAVTELSLSQMKFTTCFYGGFDGWDIYRTSRTNTDDFKANKYKGGVLSGTSVPGYLDLPKNAIASDYYAYLGAYRQFSNAEAVDINIFATPGIDDINNKLLIADALDVIEDPDEGRAGDAVYIATTPNKASGNGDTEDEMYSVEEVIDGLENSDIDSSYITTYWPWVKYFDANENKYINLPATKDVVRNMAYTDNTSHPWFSPAGILRGDVNCERATKKLKLQEEDALYDAMINPVKTFAVDGVKIWGNKVIYSNDSPLNRLNVRRLMLRVKKLIKSAAKYLIFEQYDTSLKNQFIDLVDPILKDVKTNKGISDYKINVDDSAEARDAHTLPAQIKIKPTPTLEWIDITFTIYPESVSFDE